ncbi:MAG: universal stress protein [Comamonadaceae bacterium]
MHRHVFVAIDNSSKAQKALEEAISLAKVPAASLCIANPQPIEW